MLSSTFFLYHRWRYKFLNVNFNNASHYEMTYHIIVQKRAETEDKLVLILKLSFRPT